MSELQTVQTINILNELFGSPIHCRVSHCVRVFNTFRGRASHEWRCKGPYDLLMMNFKKIKIPKLVFKIETYK